MQPIEKAILHVNTDLTALTQVLAWFDQFNHSPIPSETWLQCQLGLAEGFTNAVRHAHQGQADLPIELEVMLFLDRIEIRIWDQGSPFDLHHKLAALANNFDPSAEGGRGLKLMQRIADTLNYTRTADDRNCLLLIKQFAELQPNRQTEEVSVHDS